MNSFEGNISPEAFGALLLTPAILTHVAKKRARILPLRDHKIRSNLTDHRSGQWGAMMGELMMNSAHAEFERSTRNSPFEARTPTTT